MDEKKKNNVDDTKYSMETHLIYGKDVSNKWDYSHHVTAPISSSTTFRLDSVERGAAGFMQFANTKEFGNDAPIFIYDRLGEPNKDILEENLAYAEKGEMAVSFASGMGAISAVLGVLAATGDEVITHTTLYGCTISLFNNWYPRYNIGVHPIDLTNPENIYKVLSDKTKVIYFETPANPNLDIIDIEAIARIIKTENEKRDENHQIRVVVDNTFSTPYCQRPIEHGADFVVHSLTKGVGGFGTDMGGVVIGPNKYRDMLLLYRKDFGAIMNTKAAWSILTYGMPSLHIRQKHMVDSAMKVAEYLEQHPKVEFVNYPGLKSSKNHEVAKRLMRNYAGEFTPGSLVYFVLKGKDANDSKMKGGKLMDYTADNAYTLTLAVSLGHTRTLIEHPASMTHSVVPPEKLEERGIKAGGVRIAFGLENADDIIKDLEIALEQI
ncbi:MAG: L-methionine gamma-lyase [Melioribacteraceae bacterium]|nr:MAG: L-methionine gamma-lyase [Melioribacteraceae bacterium]